MDFIPIIIAILAIRSVAKHWINKRAEQRLLGYRSTAPKRKEVRQLLETNRQLQERVENLEYIITSMDKEIIEVAGRKNSAYPSAKEVADLKRMMQELQESA